MEPRGLLSQEMRAGRIVSKGQITSLTEAFHAPQGEPFSIMVIPTANIETGLITQPTNIGIIIPVILYNETEAATGDFPLIFAEWTPAAIYEIPIGAIDLVTYAVYWGL